jgi:DNA modification methylase
VIYYGDCASILPELDCKVDAVITDPPYGLANYDDPAALIRGWLDDGNGTVSRGFMGERWDVLPPPALWRRVRTVLQPGAHAAIMASPRTLDLMTLSLRLAGFEIRDTLMWVYAHGMPKGKMIGGRGTTLKPGYEPIILCRNPGVGLLNIEACRVNNRHPSNILFQHTENCHCGGTREIKNKSGDVTGREPSAKHKNCFASEKRHEWTR